ncbi:MAG TPA: hypothetical protein VFJ75_07215, partial [Gaiellaceae bacterium]|nr:hypothetical protein [Gaiellaceae bacterium]
MAIVADRHEVGQRETSNWAWRTLRLRVVDWTRLRVGRTRRKFAGGAVYERPSWDPALRGILEKEIADKLRISERSASDLVVELQDGL